MIRTGPQGCKDFSECSFKVLRSIEAVVCQEVDTPVPPEISDPSALRSVNITPGIAAQPSSTT